MFESSLAYVGDNSFFAFTSPIAGQRFRLEVSPTIGTLSYQTLLADYRRYFLMRPVSFAFRGMHYGRYGKAAADNRLAPLFLGYPSLVRGYDTGSFDASECSDSRDASCPEFDRLIGSKIGVASAELRIPLFGTEEFGLLNFPFLPTEIAPFVDAGLAWDAGDDVVFGFERDGDSFRVPVFSAGMTARMNVLGYLVAEVYYAYPFQRPDKGWHFGFNIAPGW